MHNIYFNTGNQPRQDPLTIASIDDSTIDYYNIKYKFAFKQSYNCTC